MCIQNLLICYYFVFPQPFCYKPCCYGFLVFFNGWTACNSSFWSRIFLIFSALSYLHLFSCLLLRLFSFPAIAHHLGICTHQCYAISCSWIGSSETRREGPRHHLARGYLVKDARFQSMLSNVFKLIYASIYTEIPLAENINNSRIRNLELSISSYLPSKLGSLTTDIFLFKDLRTLQVCPIREGEWNKNIRKIYRKRKKPQPYFSLLITPTLLIVYASTS